MRDVCNYCTEEYSGTYEEHKLECKIWLKCEYCLRNIRPDFMILHQKTKCDKNIMECQYCETSMSALEYDKKHKQNITKCSYCELQYCYLDKKNNHYHCYNNCSNEHINEFCDICEDWYKIDTNFTHFTTGLHIKKLTEMVEKQQKFLNKMKNAYLSSDLP